MDLMHSVHTLLSTLPPDGAISKAILNHHTESGGRQVASKVLLYEGKRLYTGGSPKAAHIRTKRLKIIRSIPVSSSGVG